MPSFVVTKVPAKSKGTAQLALNLWKPWRARVRYFGEREYFLGWFASREEAAETERRFRELTARK